MRFKKVYALIFHKRRATAAVRKAMLVEFVPRNLGFEHVTRQEVISCHTRQLAQTLFSDVEKPGYIGIGWHIYLHSQEQQLPLPETLLQHS